MLYLLLNDLNPLRVVKIFKVLKTMIFNNYFQFFSPKNLHKISIQSSLWSMKSLELIWFKLILSIKTELIMSLRWYFYLWLLFWFINRKQDGKRQYSSFVTLKIEKKILIINTLVIAGVSLKHLTKSCIATFHFFIEK